MAPAKPLDFELDVDSLLELHSSDDDDNADFTHLSRTLDEILNDSSDDSPEDIAICPSSPNPPKEPKKEDGAPESNILADFVHSKRNFEGRRLSVGLRRNFDSLDVTGSSETSETNLEREGLKKYEIRQVGGLSLSDRFPGLLASLRPSPKPGAASGTLQKNSKLAEISNSFSAAESDTSLELNNTSEQQVAKENVDEFIDSQRNSSISAENSYFTKQDEKIHRACDFIASSAAEPFTESERSEKGFKGNNLQAEQMETHLESAKSDEYNIPEDVKTTSNIGLDGDFPSERTHLEIVSSTEYFSERSTEVHVTDIAEISGKRIDEMDDKKINVDEETKESLQAERKEEGKKKPRTPLEMAEEIEKTDASSGLHWEEGAASQPMRLEGIRRGPPAIGHLHIDVVGYLSQLFSSSAFKRDHGSPQCLAVHLHFVVVGMSKGSVFVFPSKQSPNGDIIDNNKVVCLTYPAETIRPPVTSMSFNQQGDLLLAGYANGGLILWEPPKSTPSKVITVNHSSAVVYTLFLGQDSQNARQFKAISSDCKGNAFIHTITVLPIIRMYNVASQCLLDSRASEKALCISPLLVDESQMMTSVTGQAVNSLTSSTLGDMMGGVVGSDSAKKMFLDSSHPEEGGGVVILISQRFIVVVRLIPTLSFCAKVARPDGIRDGAIPYAAWRHIFNTKETITRKNVSNSIPNGNFEQHGLMSASDSAGTQNSHDSEGSDNAPLLAIAWDKKVQVAQLSMSTLKVIREWNLDCSACGVAWLEDQMLLILNSRGQLCLFTIEGVELDRRRLPSDSSVIYHTHFINSFGNPEKAYHNSLAVRGTTLYVLGPTQVYRSHLLPWKERIKVLQDAGDWMGALQMAMDLYDGNAQGVTGLPKTLDALREAIMPFLLQVLSAYVDEAFSYIALSFSNQHGKIDLEMDIKNKEGLVDAQIKEQFARVGCVAIEFCVHIKRNDVLFEDVFSKFTSVHQEGTFLELLEPYILKDILGFLPPEIMQALVEHYSKKGWLQRIEQCVLHMDIASLDFNQVVKLCKEHGLYSALIYLFNRGLDDFKTPLEELLAVAQDWERHDAQAFGYKILVYLKYCFRGLAFPPGHGYISPERLPSLRQELLQFLLASQRSEDNQSASPHVPIQPYSNLLYLLLLDTEAALRVLSYAFIDGPSSMKSMDTSNMQAENMLGSLLQETKVSPLAQNLINTLTEILESKFANALRVPEYLKDNTHENMWPSNYERHILLEFIACFVASKHAFVSKAMLTCILEHLTNKYESSIDGFSNGCSVEASKANEKLMLALLKAVPMTEWDTSYALELAQHAQFFQVLGFIYTLKGNYAAALESYVSDNSNIIYAFAYISSILKKLECENRSIFLDFRLAVLDRMPDLIRINREAAFLLVLEHFNKDNQEIISRLERHPEIRFLYLKTVVEVKSHGKFQSPLQPLQDVSGPLHFGCRGLDESKALTEYLGRASNLPLLLQDSGIQVTDEIAELYLELLCQFEPNSVLHFLENYENYRLEHCLRLCQEYGVTDAAAFLLERVGDVGNALKLIISEINGKFRHMDNAVANWFANCSAISNSAEKQMAVLLMIPEVQSVQSILHTAIGLCQRNTLRLQPQESESIWFSLLDVFGGPLQELYICEKAYREGRVHSDALVVGESKDLHKWKVISMWNAAHFLRKIFAHFIGEITEGMMGHIPLPIIMRKLLSDHRNQEFKELKTTIVGMVGTYGFERTILDTAKTLIEDDTYYNLSILKRGASRAFSPTNTFCCICRRSFVKDSFRSQICLLSCGHSYHLQCEDGRNSSIHNRDIIAVCPICMPKKSVVPTTDNLVQSGNKISKPSQIPATQSPNGITLTERSYYSRQQSRFEVLSRLQKNGKSLDFGLLPALRLSPPLVYHERKSQEIFRPDKEVIEQTSQKYTALQHTKSVPFHLPLKSSIFGSKKSRKQ